MVKKTFWVKKIFWVKRNLGKKFGGQKNFGSKFFSVIKILGKKIFWVKKFWAKKVWSKDLDLKFFCLKKQVGLNQGGGYMTPPQKIVGIKLCFIVFSYDW